MASQCPAASPPPPCPLASRCRPGRAARPFSATWHGGAATDGRGWLSGQLVIYEIQFFFLNININNTLNYIVKLQNTHHLYISLYTISYRTNKNKNDRIFGEGSTQPPSSKWGPWSLQCRRSKQQWRPRRYHFLLKVLNNSGHHGKTVRKHGTKHLFLKKLHETCMFLNTTCICKKLWSGFQWQVFWTSAVRRGVVRWLIL